MFRSCSSHTAINYSSPSADVSMTQVCRRCETEQEIQNLLTLLDEAQAQKGQDDNTEEIADLQKRVATLGWLANRHDARDHRSLTDALESILKEPYERKYDKLFRNFHVVAAHQQLTQEEKAEVEELCFLFDDLKDPRNQCAHLHRVVQAEAILQRITRDKFITEPTRQKFRAQIQNASFISDWVELQKC